LHENNFPSIPNDVGKIWVMALSEFKPNFYDLDIEMPHMNGFELSENDINVKVCFMSSGEINREALREIYPSLVIFRERHLYKSFKSLIFSTTRILIKICSITLFLSVVCPTN
jgi:hypothetical protein